MLLPAQLPLTPGPGSLQGVEEPLLDRSVVRVMPTVHLLARHSAILPYWGRRSKRVSFVKKA